MDNGPAEGSPLAHINQQGDERNLGGGTHNSNPDVVGSNPSRPIDSDFEAAKPAPNIQNGPTELKVGDYADIGTVAAAGTINFFQNFFQVDDRLVDFARVLHGSAGNGTPHPAGGGVAIDVISSVPESEEDFHSWFWGKELDAVTRAYLLSLSLVHGAEDQIVNKISAAFQRFLMSKADRKLITSPLQNSSLRRLSGIVRRLPSGRVTFDDASSDGASRTRELLRSVLIQMWDNNYAQDNSVASIGSVVERLSMSTDGTVAGEACQGWGWYMVVASRSAFERQVDRWAESELIFHGLAAALSCRGAVIADRSRTLVKKESSELIQPWIIDKISKWSGAPLDTIGDRRRWTAAACWTGLGDLMPSEAMNGLRKVMNYPATASTPMQSGSERLHPAPEIAYPVTFGWQVVAAAGYLREVLRHLAEAAQESLVIRMPFERSIQAVYNREHAKWSRYLSVLALDLLVCRTEDHEVHRLPDEAPPRYLGVTGPGGINSCLWLALSTDERAAKRDLATIISVGIGGETDLEQLVASQILSPWARASRHQLWASAFWTFVGEIGYMCQTNDHARTAAGFRCHASERLTHLMAQWKEQGIAERS